MSGPSRRDNLPAELTGFVGRRAEVTAIARMLPHTRLVTLTGPGGVGKTRLALRVADQVRRAFPDGVWLVELAALRDPDLLAATVAAVWGVADRAAVPIHPLTAYLKDKRLLLIVDNCEHLLDGCAPVLGKLLAAAPGLHVLATSRQSLRLDGEHVVPVPSLSTPDPAALPAGTLDGFDAVRLFVERAQSVVAGFEVTADNREAVAAICHHLSGLPLAIELAVAWLPVLSPEQIRQRLTDDFRLLRRGSRVAPPRHQTLQAAMDSSYRLCSPVEQMLWARASVFVDGFEMDAAERVCAGAGIPRCEVFELVAELVNKSVLTVEPEAPMRYGMLEPVRRYGRFQLIASGGQSAARRRHLDYYRELVQRAEAEMFSPRQVAWLLRLRREYPNLRAALESALADAEGGAALEMCAGLHDFWFGAGRYRESLGWLTRALAADQRPSVTRVIALAEAGCLAVLLGDPDAGRPLLAEAQALADERGDPHAIAVTKDRLFATALFTRPADLGQALQAASQSIAAARAAGDAQGVCSGLLRIATVRGLTGDPGALADVEESLAMSERCGAGWLRAWATCVLAMLRWLHGGRAQVPALLREALPVLLLVHDWMGTGFSLELFAWAAASAGEYRRASVLLGACDSVRRMCGAALADAGAYAANRAGCERASRQALGETGYATLFEEGRRFTVDEAARYALVEPTTTAGEVAPSRSAPVADPLSRREAQVAELVAEGLTNVEIANRLVISPRTAESHVQHILGKLGFTSRAQIARWVAERGAPATAPSRH